MDGVSRNAILLKFPIFAIKRTFDAARSEVEEASTCEFLISVIVIDMFPI